MKNFLITLVTLAVFWVLNAYPWLLFGQLASDAEGWPRVAALVVFRYGPWLVGPVLVAMLFFGARGSLNALGLDRSPLTGLAVSFAGTLVLLAGLAATMPLAPDEDWLISAFRFALLPGVFEEVFYRAFLFGLLFRFAAWGFLPAAFIGAIFFGAGHLYQSGEVLEAAGIFAITALGAVWFSWLYVEWEYNIWVPAGFHVLMNFYWGLFNVADTALVLLQHNIVMFSWPVSVPGKARLAGNGRSPCQEVQRCPGALTGQPEGRSRDARPPRCRACQGLRPLPAHGALRTSITRTLNTTILC